MSIGPIPFTAIVEYCKIYEVQDVEEFIYIIRVMDNKFISLRNNNDRSEHKSKSKTNRR